MQAKYIKLFIEIFKKYPDKKKGRWGTCLFSSLVKGDRSLDVKYI